MTMCTCNQNNSAEEYHTALSDLEISPEDWRTSTRYHEEVEGIPEYITSTPRRAPRRDFPRVIRRAPSRTHRLDLTAGVAIVPRRIDFDAISDIEDFADEEDENLARERLQRLRSTQRSTTSESTISPGRPRRSRPTQYPSHIMRQYTPRMIRMTPCGKCLRI